jgi:hypothetical protein
MTDALIGSRVRLEYDDQNEAFAANFPVDGTIRKRCTASTGADDWYLVKLDQPIDYQHQVGPHYQFRRLLVPHVLIRSRWADEALGVTTSPSVFLLLISDGQAVPDIGIEIDAYVHASWARCRVFDAA